jgi:integrase
MNATGNGDTEQAPSQGPMPPSRPERACQRCSVRHAYALKTPVASARALGSSRNASNGARATTTGGYVFAREDGQPHHPDAISDAFDRLCRYARVPVIGLHAALRHLHGSVLLRRGVPLHVVSRRLGHGSEAFTAKVYAHVLPGQGAEAAAAFAAVVDG